MKLIIEETENDVAQVASSLLFACMLQNRRVNLSVTAGSTPIKTYEKLTQLIKNKKYIQNTYFYNFDEIPIKGQDDADGVTMKSLRTIFYSHAGINEHNLVKLTGANYKNFDKMIEGAGGLDAIFMGIGPDGHFCGNLPNTTNFHDKTSKVDISSRADMQEILANEMLKVGLRKELAPNYYVTMGPKSVMQSKQLIMVAQGSSKAEIVKKAFFSQITPETPASILQLHPNLILLLDRQAAKYVDL